MPNPPPAKLDRFKGLDLKTQMEHFVVAYCAGFRYNPTEAYKEAYNQPDMDDKVACSAGNRLLRTVAIREAVKRQVEYQLKDKDELAKRIVDEHAKLAFSDHTGIIGEMTSFGYVVKSLDDIPEHQRATIQSVEKAENGLLKVRFYDKQKALDALARILGMNDDNSKDIGGKYEALVSSYHKAKGDKKGVGE